MIKNILHSIIERQSKAITNKIAVQSKQGSLTYAELITNANRIAGCLVESGIKQGETICVFLPASSSYIVAILGINKSGGVFLPMELSYPEKRIEYILKYIKPSLIITDVQNIDLLKKIITSSNIEYDLEGLLCLDIDDKKNVMIRFDQPTDQQSSSFKLYPELTAAPRLNGEESNYILFTSGSTGTPKAIEGCHKSLSHFIHWEINEFELDANIKVALLAPVSFDVSLRDIFVPLVCGGTICIPTNETKMNPAKLLQWIHSNKVVLLHIVPSFFRLLLDEMEARPELRECVSLIGFIFFAGEALLGKDVETWKKITDSKAEIINLYGPSETTLAKVFNRLHGKSFSANKIIPLGIPINNTLVIILNQNNHLCKIGETGEIHIKTPFKSKGYYNDPDLTAKKFIQNPLHSDFEDILFKTGDLGKYSSDGSIIFISRMDSQLKINGNRVEIAEVEKVLGLVPGIRQVLVLPDKRRDEVGLICYFTEGRPTSYNKVRAFLSKYLPSYMIPSYYIRLGKFPLTTNGKLDRKALLALKTEQTEEYEDFVPTKGQVEKELENIWKEILDVQKVSRNDSYFQIGGTSLKAMQIISRIYNRMRVLITIPDFFKASSIAELSALIASRKKKDISRVPIVKRDKTNYNLSINQERIWFLNQMYSENSVYNICATIRLSGPLDIKVSEKSLNQIIERHEVLRARFENLQGKPVHSIMPSSLFKIKTINLSGQSPAMQVSKIEQAKNEEALKPFDLASDVLIRLTILELGAEEFIIIFSMHHIVSDAWSLGILVNEFSSFYKANLNKQEVNLPPLKIQFLDYIAWHRQNQEDEDYKRKLIFWKDYLKDIPFVLNLPFDHARPRIQSFEGASYSFRIEKSLFSNVHALSQEKEVTLFMTLLSVYVILLSRYSRQTDLVIGTPVAVRNKEEYEGLIGFFVNTLPLRFDLSENPSFENLLASVKRSFLDALDHQDVQFKTIVEEIQPIRTLNHSPIFQVLFSFQDTSLGKFELPNVKVSSIERLNLTSKFDLTLRFQEDGDEMIGELEYSTVLFEQKTIEEFAQHYLNILQDGINNPDRSILKLRMVQQGQINELLQNWNNTVRSFSVKHRLYSLIDRLATQSPDQVAVQFEDQYLTYQELNQRANQLANFLKKSGVQTGSYVGIMLPRSLNLMIALVSVLKTGGVYIPLDSSYPAERLDYIIRDSGLQYIITEEEVSSELHSNNVVQIQLNRIWAEIQAEDIVCLYDDFDENELCYIIYTSGSTGKPKGVMISHKALMNFLFAMKEKLHFGPKDTLVAVTSISFDIAALELFFPIIAGGKVVIASETEVKDAVALAQILKNTNANYMQATPITWQMLLETSWKGHEDFIALCGGEKLSRNLANQLHKNVHTLWNMYGPTETTIWSAMYKVSPSPDENIPIGLPIANTQLYILDATLHSVPIGVPGELYIAGDGLAKGYINKAELTAQKFVTNPFSKEGNHLMFKTGDLAKYRRDGNIAFCGRMDFQLKYNGFRIEAGEIEHTLNLHPSIKDSVVKKVENDRNLNRLVAFIVQNGIAEANISELRSHLQKKLPIYMVPTDFVFMDSFPLTLNKKIDRKKLVLPKDLKLQEESTYMAPRNRKEEHLCNIISKVLDIEKVSVLDNYFDLGGASIQSIEIVGKAKEVGLQLKPETIFEYQIIEKIAASSILLESPLESKLTRKVKQMNLETEQPATAENEKSAQSKEKTDIGNMLIESIGVYLPSNVLTTSEIIDNCKHNLKFPLEKFTGIKSRRVVNDIEFSIDLAIRAIENCLEKSKYAPDEVELLICCNISRFDAPLSLSYEPGTAIKLKKHFGFTNAEVFDISNACTGMFTAIHIMDAYIKTGKIKVGMIVSGEYISHLIKTAQLEIESFMDNRIACLTLGDAGAALILENSCSKEFGFQGLDLFTLGSYSDICIGKPTNQSHGGGIMYTETLKFAEVSLENFSKHALKVMEEADWTLHSFKHIIMHQVSRSSLKDVTKKMNSLLGEEVCTDSNVIDNLTDRGNTATTSHFVALHDNIMNNKISSGDKIFFAISGSGLNLGSAVYTLDDLPDRIREKSSIKTNRQKAVRPLSKRSQSSLLKPKVKITSYGCCPLNPESRSNSIDLAKKAAKECIWNADISRSSIELLIFAGVYRSEFISEPGIATMLAGDLEINATAYSGNGKNTFAFDVINGEIGFLNACHISVQFIQSGKYKNALITSSEIENNIELNKGEQLGIKEAGVAIFLEPSLNGETGFGNFFMKSFVEYQDSFTSNCIYQQDHHLLSFFKDEAYGDKLIQCIVNTVEEFLAEVGLSLGDFNCIIPPQISPKFTHELSRTLGVPTEKVLHIPNETKDLFTSSFVYAYAFIMNEKKPNPGEMVLHISAGSGIQIGCCIYYC